MSAGHHAGHLSGNPSPDLFVTARYRLPATPVIAIAHLLSLAVSVLMLVWIFNLRRGISFSSNALQRLFDAHPLFMLFGLIICGGQAIMAFRVVPGKKKVRKGAHVILNLGGGVLSSLGIYAVIKFFMVSGIPHAHRLHAWIGIAAISLFLLQFLIGFACFVFPGASARTRANLTPWHAFLGLVIFLLSICSAEIGLAERYIFLNLHGSEGLLVNFIGIGMLLYSMAVILTVCVLA